jgi:hypothetical protein
MRFTKRNLRAKLVRKLGPCEIWFKGKNLDGVYSHSVRLISVLGTRFIAGRFCNEAYEDEDKGDVTWTERLIPLSSINAIVAVARDKLYVDPLYPSKRVGGLKSNLPAPPTTENP